MDLKDELQNIDEFFDGLSDQEFEQMCLDHGIDKIKPLSEFGLEMGMQISKMEFEKFIK